MPWGSKRRGESSVSKLVKTQLINAKAVALVVAMVALGYFAWRQFGLSDSGTSGDLDALLRPSANGSSAGGVTKPKQDSDIDYQPRQVIDSSGYGWVLSAVKPWPADSSLEQIGAHFRSSIRGSLTSLTEFLKQSNLPPDQIASTRFSRSTFLNYEGDPIAAYEDLCQAREWVEKNPQVARDFLYTIIYFQGITAMRRGENENCILCRGETSCILPISKSAVHTNPEGSRLAMRHFTEYLDQFPDDGDARWLLNVAAMTLGEHPHAVDPKWLIDIDKYTQNNDGIGRFRDIGEAIGLNRLNQAGGAIMEDFDNDGRLDVVVTSFDPTQIMGVYFNEGNGKFSDRTADAGVANQLGGLNCVQTDYNNDGYKDVLIVRGAWLSPALAMRPTLLRNNGDRTFTDVTIDAGLSAPINSISATWADYDNDGWLDVFVCCEQQANRLYRNRGDGTFEEVSKGAGVSGGEGFACKGANWIDFDNDGWPDLFLNHLSNVGAQLFRNKHDGTFENVSTRMKIGNPQMGFSCWAWDYNNDGWQDIFATNYSRSMTDCVAGMIGNAPSTSSSSLYMNLQGNGFQDVTKEMGLDHVYITMGSNFADFDNDGWQDFYLGTGDPLLGTLIPNRMFRNMGAKRFVDITSSSGTGNLQKGHGVACGDWDRNGAIDLFIEMGGAVNGDKYHNIMFQNPGNTNAWVNLRLTGVRTNKAAIGARLKIETDSEEVPVIYRHITSGSSFGANPLESTIGLGKATKIRSVEVHWPTSQTTQTFRDIEIHRSYELIEFDEQAHDWPITRVELPEIPS